MDSSCPSFGVCSNAESCDYGDGDTISHCWLVVWLQLAAGAVMVFYGDHCLHRTSPVVKLVKWLTGYDLEQPTVSGKDEERQKKLDAFFTTQRTEENFIKDTADPTVEKPNKPVKGKYQWAEFHPTMWSLSTFSMLSSFRYIFFARYVHSVLLGSLGWACLSSAFSTVLWLMMAHEEYCEANFGETGTTIPYLEELAAQFRALRSSYVFLPALLLTLYIRFAINNWRAWLKQCYRLQGQCSAVALFAGGTWSLPVKDEVRKKLYQIYRYLGLLHALIYKSISTKLKGYSLQEEFVHKLNLCTEKEAAVLAKEEHAKYLVLSWLLHALVELTKMEDWTGTNEILTSLLTQIKDLRSSAGMFSGRLDMPNLYVQMMFLVVSFWMFLIVVGVPFSSLIYTGKDNQLNGTDCFQPMVLLTVFILSGTLRIAFILLYVLRYPFFTDGGETLVVEEFLAYADRQSFAIIRSLFGYEKIKEGT